MTNADKVRQMTDEELLEWLRMLKWLDGLTCACMEWLRMPKWLDGLTCACMDYDHWRCDDYEDCRTCWKDWLAEEADEKTRKWKMTNAEWIRTMSDEELMGWLCDVGACMVDHCVDNRCRECWKDWLAEDADEIKTEEEEGK